MTMTIDPRSGLTAEDVQYLQQHVYPNTPLQCNADTGALVLPWSAEIKNEVIIPLFWYELTRDPQNFWYELVSWTKGKSLGEPVRLYHIRDVVTYIRK